MNQSTVSYWLERLRYRFKDPLFIRSGAGVIPTQRAESLIPQAKSLLHALKTFSQNDEYTPSEDNATLKIAVNSVERDLVVQPLLSKAREVAPNLKFEIHATGSNHQVAKAYVMVILISLFFHQRWSLQTVLCKDAYTHLKMLYFTIRNLALLRRTSMTTAMHNMALSR